MTTTKPRALVILYMDYSKLLDKLSAQVPALGETVKGKIVHIGRNEVRIDIDGVYTGLVRGRELYKESTEYSGLKVGAEVEATVIDTETPNGELELSFRYAGHHRAWENLLKFKEEAEVVPARIVDANKGGLMIKVGHVPGFLPVSQLIPEHYPRVQGGDKNKILERLKSYIGQDFSVKVLDADMEDEKLIVSEKAAWEDKQKELIAQYQVGSNIKGVVTAVTDFGVFVQFGENLEGLVHISEIAWQRIDDPRKLVSVGEEIEAQIIKIENSKIFLSMKALIQDPWANITEKYNIGDKVKGKVLKVNPFGLFVELDADIHGLAHISELSNKQVNDPAEIAQPGDVLEFRILTIEPKKHRLGLSIKALSAKKAPAKKTEEAPKEEAKKEEVEA